jgi:hypothetical protein
VSVNNAAAIMHCNVFTSIQFSSDLNPNQFSFSFHRLAGGGLLQLCGTLHDARLICYLIETLPDFVD